MRNLRSLIKSPGCFLTALGLLVGLALVDTLRHPEKQWTAKTYDAGVRVYQAAFSPHLARHVSCRFLPSCSAYSRQAVAQHGLWRGLALTLRRLSRCRPGVPPGTVDEVPSVRPATHSSPRLPGRRLACMADSLGWAATAAALAELGSSEAALRASDRSLALAPCLGLPRAYSTLWLLRGQLFFQLGRPVSAAEAGRLAIASALEAGDFVGVSAGHSFLAQVAVERGDFGVAVAELEAARQVVKQAGGSSFDGASRHLVEGLAPLMLMSLYTLEFESPSAAASVASENTQGRPRSTIRIRRSLARSSLGLSRAAHRGLVVTRQHWNVGKMRRWLAPFIKARARSVGATLPGDLLVEHYECEFEGQRLTPQGLQPRATRFLGIWTLFAEMAGQRERALRYSEREVLSELSSGDGDDAAVALIHRARLFLGAGQGNAAIDSAARALACVDQSAAKTRSVEWMGSSAGGLLAPFVQGLLFELLVMEGRDREAMHVAERSRSRALHHSMALRSDEVGHLPASSASEEFAALQSEMRQIERELVRRVGFERDQLEQKLAALRFEFDGLRVRTAIRSSEFSSVVSPTATSVTELQSELDSDVTLVSYYFADSGLHAWVVENDSFAAFTLEGPTTDWTAVPCFADFARRSRGAERVERACADGQELAESLYGQLIAPLRGAIHHSRLILVPHGQLHFVPFGALRNPETGRLLVEDFTITHAPSASVLQFLREKESTFEGRALVLGDPQTPDPGLERLPASALEAVMVAGLFGTVPRLGPMAAEAALDPLNGEIDVLHLAAHGIYEPASPRFSRIALAPGGGHDGYLEVHEIYSRLDLRGVNLVVLSACDSALGERTGGDEIVGLTRSLLYAGASGVVSTLWKVDDAASTELMVVFYRRLRAGETAARALRQAQLETKNQPGREDPYFWAGFVLTGDPQARWTPSTQPHPR